MTFPGPAADSPMDVADSTSTLMMDNDEYPDKAFVATFLGSFLTVALGAEDLMGA